MSDSTISYPSWLQIIREVAPEEGRAELEALISEKGIPLEEEAPPEEVKRGLLSLHHELRRGQSRFVPVLFHALVSLTKDLRQKMAGPHEDLIPSTTESVARALDWEPMSQEAGGSKVFSYHDRKGRLFEIELQIYGKNPDGFPRVWLTFTQVLPQVASSLKLEKDHFQAAIMPLLIERLPPLEGIALLFRTTAGLSTNHILWKTSGGTVEELRADFNEAQPSSVSTKKLPLPGVFAEHLGWVPESAEEVPHYSVSGRRFQLRVGVGDSSLVEVKIEQMVENLFHLEERISPREFEKTILAALGALINVGETVSLRYVEDNGAFDSLTWIKTDSGFESFGKPNNQGSRSKREYQLMAQTLLSFGLKPQVLPLMYNAPLFSDSHGSLLRPLFSREEPHLLILRVSGVIGNSEKLYAEMRQAFFKSCKEGRMPPETVRAIRIDTPLGSLWHPLFLLRRVEKDGEVDYEEPQLSPQTVAAALNWEVLSTEGLPRFKDKKGRVMAIEVGGLRLVKITQVVPDQKSPLRLSREAFEKEVIPVLASHFVDLQRIILNYTLPSDLRPIFSAHWRYSLASPDQDGTRGFARVAHPHSLNSLMSYFGFRVSPMDGLKNEAPDLVWDFNIFGDEEGRLLAARRVNGELSLTQLQGAPLNPAILIRRFDQKWESGSVVEHAVDRLHRIIYRLRSRDNGIFSYALEKTLEEGRIRFVRQRLKPSTVAEILGWAPLPDTHQAIQNLSKKITKELFSKGPVIYGIEVFDRGRRRPAEIRFTRILNRLTGGSGDWLDDFEREVLASVWNRLPQVDNVVLEGWNWNGSLWDTVGYERRHRQFVRVLENFDGSQVERLSLRLKGLMGLFDFHLIGKPEMWVVPLFGDDNGRKMVAVVRKNTLWMIQTAGPKMPSHILKDHFAMAKPSYLKQGKEPLSGIDRILWLSASDGADAGDCQFVLVKNYTARNGNELIDDPTAPEQGQQVPLPLTLNEIPGEAYPHPVLLKVLRSSEDRRSVTGISRREKEGGVSARPGPSRRGRKGDYDPDSGGPSAFDGAVIFAGGDLIGDQLSVFGDSSFAEASADTRGEDVEGSLAIADNFPVVDDNQQPIADNRTSLFNIIGVEDRHLTTDSIFTIVGANFSEAEEQSLSPDVSTENQSPPEVPMLRMEAPVPGFHSVLTSNFVFRVVK